MTRPLIIVLLAFGLTPGVPGQDDSGETHDSGLTVEVGVSRLFLDVEVVDADGRPIPGLTQEDFTIRLNNREYPIYSVDDLCGCGDGPPGTSPNFILFFDFSQIGSRWRETALREAERWANEIKRPEERTMVVAYATPSGLRTLCRLTDDPEKLVASIRGARADSGIDDPFPDRQTQRFENCVDGTVSCRNSGMREYRHLYEFEILGEEETLGRPAVKVRIAALPPHVDGLNQWFGAAWVDRDTHQLLRFRGLEVEDREAKELYDKGVVQEGSPFQPRSHFFDEIDVEFGVRSGEIRFPNRVVTERTEFETSWGAGYLRTEGVRNLRTVQSYDNYRIFGVRSAETIERILED